MNQYLADKKTNADLRRQLEHKNKELQGLKDQLEESNRRQSSLLQINPVASQERISQLEAEVEELTQRSSQQSFNQAHWNGESLGHSSPVALRGSNDFQIFEDNVAEDDHVADGDDALAMGLELESARQEKQALFRSSQGCSNPMLHFQDSPVRPSTSQMRPPVAPTFTIKDLSNELNFAINRAEEAEVALQAMNLEIKSLGFPCNDHDAAECIESIKNHFRDTRVELERVLPGETIMSFDNSRLMPEIISKLKMISRRVQDREAELKSMRDQQRSLKGNFEHALIATEKANARIKELEEAIDHNAEEMLEQRMRAQALEREAQEHEANSRSLIQAIEKYRQEVQRLEQLVEMIEAEQAARLQDVRTATEAEFSQQMSDMDAKVAAETRGRRSAEESAVERLRKINELEATLSTARQHSEDVKEQLRALEQRLAASTRSHEEEVGGLNSRVSSLSTALSAANAEIDKLRKANGKLEDRYRHEVEQGAQVVERMQHEFLRSAAKVNEEKKSYIRGAKVRYANWELESDDLASDDISGGGNGAPMTPVSSVVRFSEFSEIEDASDDHVDGRVEISRGRSHSVSRRPRHSLGAPGLGIMKHRTGGGGGRRRYDSGIGMNSSSDAEGEGEEDGRSPDLLSPDFSSEADIEIDLDIDVDVEG